MNYFILILVTIAGIVLGLYLGRKRKIVIMGQIQEKEENKEKILEHIQENQKITNNEIEKLLGVSNATATRYTEELEREDKISQNDINGQGVHYVLK